MTKRNDCRRFNYNASLGYITDDLTGKKYSTLGSLCKLLNEESDRGDRNAEMYYDLKLELDAIKKVMSRYGIDDVEKLNLVLFYEKVW